MKPTTNNLSVVLERFTPIFVSGSPRSGTTICHALLCTAENVNDYVPESSFLSGILNNFIVGLNNDFHNVDFFGSKQAFIDYGIEQIASMLMYSWLRFDTPEFLALKDPLMFTHMNWIHQAFPNVRYVFTLRDPIETISSRVTVERRMGKYINNELVSNISAELSGYYNFISHVDQNCKNRLTVIHYDEIMSGSVKERFKEISPSIQVDQNRVWISKFMAKVKDSPWTTESYGKRILDVKRAPIVLDEAQAEIVTNICGESYVRACAMGRYMPTQSNFEFKRVGT
jgi:hypothetical protein